MQGVSQKVLTYFFEMVNQFVPDDIVVCWDKGKSRWRTEIYKEYKAQRLQKKKDAGIDWDGFDEQSMYIKGYLDSLGVRQFTIPGVEADDVLAWLAEYYVSVLGEWGVILSTGDRDLWQLVSEHLQVWDHQKNLFVTQEVAHEYFGVGTELIADLKSLAGDVSDNLPGVKGIGDKKAAVLLNEYGSLGALLDPANRKALESRKTTAKIFPEADFVGEMYRLVKIPTLAEGMYCFSEQEAAVFTEAATKELSVDTFRMQILSQRTGKHFPLRPELLSRRSADLSGMVDYMQAYAPPGRSWESLRELDWAIAECNRCPLRSGCSEKGPLMAEGADDRDIMILGRNPDEVDSENGVPFCADGAVGGELGEFLKQIGVSRDECWFTNVCRCVSPDNRPPTYPEMLACLPYLRAEIDHLRPKLIIALGYEAMVSVTPYRSNVSKHCGEILDKPAGLVGAVDAKVAISVHPLAALRSQRGEVELEYAATMLHSLLTETVVS